VVAARDGKRKCISVKLSPGLKRLFICRYFGNDDDVSDDDDDDDDDDDSACA